MSTPPPNQKPYMATGKDNKDNNNTPVITIGNQRFQSERRQYGGLLILLGFCALIQPLANISTFVDSNGPTPQDPTQVNYWQFVGSCCLFAIGVTAMLEGYVEAIQDWGEVTLHTIGIVITQVRKIPKRSALAVFVQLFSLINTVNFIFIICLVCIYSVFE